MSQCRNRTYQRAVKQKAPKANRESACITSIFLKNLAESLPQYIFWKNAQSVYLGCNQNFAQLVGLKTSSEIVGKTDYDLNWHSTGHTATTFQQGDRNTLSGKPITNQEEILALPNGKLLTTLISKLPIMDQGKSIGIVGYFTDITQIKQKEAALIAAKKQAETANRAKSQFLANMRHDLRTPLSGIVSFADLIQTESQAPHIKRYAQYLKESGEALFALTARVLEVVESDVQQEPSCCKFDLKETLASVFSLYLAQAKSKGLDYHLTCDPAIPTYLRGDMQGIYRVVMELLANAIKFTHTGHVRLCASLAKQSAQDVVIKIQVSDTGIGISKDKQTEIFGKFTRLSPAYAGFYSGYGLGLYLVQENLQRLQGELYTESAPDQGATFTVILPLKKPLLDEPLGCQKIDVATIKNPPQTILKDHAKSANADASAKSGSCRILLVEDTKTAAMAMTAMLENLGYPVDHAQTGEAGLEKAKTHPYDLILMDIGLPGISGTETTRKMRALGTQACAKVPIIGITAHVYPEEKQACLDAGMQDVFLKPLMPKLAKRLIADFVRNDV